MDLSTVLGLVATFGFICPPFSMVGLPSHYRPALYSRCWRGNRLFVRGVPDPASRPLSLRVKHRCGISNTIMKRRLKCVWCRIVPGVRMPVVETAADEAEDPFIAQDFASWRMVMKHPIESVMFGELDKTSERHNNGALGLHSVFGPAMGLISALIGLVQMLETRRPDSDWTGDGCRVFDHVLQLDYRERRGYFHRAKTEVPLGAELHIKNSSWRRIAFHSRG